MTGRRVIASNVSFADELTRRAGHDGGHLVAAFLQPAHDLDRLIGADAAGYAKCDKDMT